MIPTKTPSPHKMGSRPQRHESEGRFANPSSFQRASKPTTYAVGLLEDFRESGAVNVYSCRHTNKPIAKAHTIDMLRETPR